MLEQQKGADEKTQATTLSDMLMMIAAHDEAKQEEVLEREDPAQLNHHQL